MKTNHTKQLDLAQFEGHTPGPWTSSGITVSTLDGDFLLACRAGHPQAKRNARRIVACVNACEGISTETLYMSPSLTVGEDTERAALLAECRRQREEIANLKYALRFAADWIDPKGNSSPEVCAEVVKTVESALKATE